MVGEVPALQLALRWLGGTQPLLLPRADRPAAALVPSTSHGAARIMIELRNKHTLTGKLCCFQIVLARSSAAISLSLRSKGLCRRIHFGRVPSVNDGRSDMTMLACVICCHMGLTK
jgi:hypothetical protein